VERAEVLAAFACVDAVVVFDEDTPQAIISKIQPDVLVKGADWPADRIIGRDIVEARGGRGGRVPLAEAIRRVGWWSGSRVYRPLDRTPKTMASSSRAGP
jgi:bifunctional ADP-heptose synthase (sugar kinase/adenylyltransferase)